MDQGGLYITMEPEVLDQDTFRNREAAMKRLEQRESGHPAGQSSQVKEERRMTVPPTPPPKETKFAKAAIPVSAVPAPAPTTFSATTSPTLGGTGLPQRGLPSHPRLPQPPAKAVTARPQAPLAMNPPTRPGTSASQASTVSRIVGSTKRLSFSSLEWNRRPIKYGTGAHSNTELNPQPSDDPDDPLNWPRWRKELNFWSLMLMVIMVGVMKTAFLTVNSVLSDLFVVSFTAATALTGVPLILSAFSGVACLMGARIWGKRPFYLASLLLVFIGAVWNTSVSNSYGQCMTARVFQGLGWGAFDFLVLGSIYDTFFEHERGTRVAIHAIATASSTWGAPIIGGFASQTPVGFSLQFTILSSFFVVAVPLVVLGAPETVFDRAYTLSAPATSNSISSFKKPMKLNPRKLISIETAREYASKLKPVSYVGPTNSRTLLQAPRACVAPTTLLVALVSIVPVGAVWGLTQSLSLVFSPMPFNMTPGNIGVLMTAPWLLATAVVALLAFLPRWGVRMGPRWPTFALAGASVLSMVGILALGLHIAMSMTRPPGDNGETSVFALNYLGARVSVVGSSILMGLAASGMYMLEAIVRPVIESSTQFTSSNLGVAQRNTHDMAAGVRFWTTLIAAIFVMTVPMAAWSWDGLRSLVVGLAVTQGLLAAGVGALWYWRGECVWRLDGRVMRLVDLSMLRKAGSFFDLD